jgi:hypothetical protein
VRLEKKSLATRMICESVIYTLFGAFFYLKINIRLAEYTNNSLDKLFLTTYAKKSASTKRVSIDCLTNSKTSIKRLHWLPLVEV